MGSAAPTLQNVTITAARDVTFTGTVATAGNLTQAAGTGTTTLNGGSVGGDLSIAADKVVLNSGTLTVVGTTTFTAGGTGVSERIGAA